MRRKVLAAALLAAALVAPANAAVAAPTHTPWPSIPCPRGALMADQSEVDPEGVVVVPGVINCGVAEPGPLFAVAVFETGARTGYVTSPLLQYYASPKGPTPFTVVGFRVAEVFTSASLCLMTDLRTRLSCVHVSTDMEVSRISTMDRRVRKPVRPQLDEDTPNCGTCWSVN